MKTITIQKISTAIIQLILAIAGILCLSSLPSLFKGMEIDINNYFKALGDLCKKLLDFSHLTYGKGLRPIFPQILEFYWQSLGLFMLALVISVLCAFCFTYLIIRFFYEKVKRMKFVLVILESIPDLFIIMCFQIVVLWLFQKTDIMVFNIATTWQEKSILMPVVCLSIPPTIMLTRIFLLQVEAELQKDYIAYARAKGLNFYHIFRHHVLRNVLFSMFHYSKTIVWFMFSNLLMVEYLFNVLGIVSFVLKYPFPEVFVVTLLLLYIPFFIIYKAYDLFVPAVMRGEGV
ncbi:ABC transporter permease subunit [Bacillus sp. WLY-B-L8]|uniref:ABC transporter permease subunit n=1 Tax=Bacillus multifaciens TaxID=3068506 RepID=UPI0027427F2E|nr:ABC transporter permease subunit [Bacillus sp. WLY-B-L8]MDP7981176.1 ABC transporter permease subunit [Bacillus sp. WLY-B-L8]